MYLKHVKKKKKMIKTYTGGKVSGHVTVND